MSTEIERITTVHAPTSIRRTGMSALAVALLSMLVLTFSTGRASALPGPCSAHGDSDDAARAYVCFIYDIALHSASNAEVAYWIDVINHQGRSYATVALLNSPESIRTFVDQGYGQFLDRAGDPAGDHFWSDLIGGGARFETFELGLTSSDEAYALNGGTDDGYVVYLYEAILQRSPSADEEAYWAGLLTGGAVSRVQLASLFVHSQEATMRQVTQAYSQYLGRTPDADGAAYWASVLDSTGLLHMLESLIASDESFGRITGP